MEPYPTPRKRLQNAILFLLLCGILASCEQAGDIVDEICDESQSFTLAASTVENSSEDGSAPDLRVTVFTVDEESGCLTTVLDVNCIAGDCEQSYDIGVDRQEMFIRIVARDEGGMRNLDVSTFSGQLAQEGEWTTASWVDFDYSLNGTRAELLSDAPSDAVYFQDKFEVNANSDAASISIRAVEEGLPGAEAAVTNIAVSVTHLEDLPTTLP